MCVFRIDLCRFFYTPGRGGIRLRLLDHKSFFASSPEPAYPEESMMTKQENKSMFQYNISLTIDLYNMLILFLPNFMKQRVARSEVLNPSGFF